MEIESSEMASRREDFGFGFNDPDFSDRLLRIELLQNDLNKENVVEVKTLHINSLILATKSPYFHKLFKNGMRESQQKDATLKINAYEDAALMEVLKFMYSNTLSATSPDLLDVFLVADKFEVTCCMSYCHQLLLQKKPMSQKSALSYLQLPRSYVEGQGFQPFIDAAKEFLVARYSGLHKSGEREEEVMGLPLFAVEAVLGSDALQVDTEDDVFDFVLKWANKHYPKRKERREILTKHLTRCIRFSHMSRSKLKEALDCPDFGYDQVSKLVTDALFNADATSLNSLGRIYRLRPIKVVQFELPRPSCVVYFDLKKEECANLTESISLKSRPFCLGGRWFFLMAQFYKDQQCFGLFLNMTEDSESCTIDCEFAVLTKWSRRFQYMTWFQHKYPDSGSYGCGYPDLFRIPWMGFMSEDSEYFVDGILHLQADVTINNVVY